MAKTYMGKAALTLVRANGGMAYVYAGHLAPEGMDPADVKRLVDEGFLVEVADVEDPPPVEDPVNPEPPAFGERPARTANKAAWAGFRGLTEEQAEDVTVQQLQDDAFMTSYQPSTSSPAT